MTGCLGAIVYLMLLVTATVAWGIPGLIVSTIFLLLLSKR